jgi:hypothetical protein
MPDSPTTAAKETAVSICEVSQGHDAVGLRRWAREVPS